MAQEASQEQVVQAIYEHAATLVKAGKSQSEVRQDLESRGISSEIASLVANNIFNLRTEALKKAGQKNMLVGGLFCVGGIIVTAVTYSMAASSPSGGTYIVTWGAIIFGAIQFLRGVAQALGHG